MTDEAVVICGVDFDEADFTLLWPRELFAYEAKQILRRSENEHFSERVACLCAEAFMDDDIEQAITRSSQDWTKANQDSQKEAQRFLEKLISEPHRLRGYERRRYYHERFQGSHQTALRAPLSVSFYRLVEEMENKGYFPRILPIDCQDQPGLHAVTPAVRISEAVGADVKWPEDLLQDTLPEPVLYSVIEFFHDEAQRPRRRCYHSFGDCGYHYLDYSKSSGSVIYRWRVNELLSQHGVELKLGNEGPEEGLLIRHSSLSLDDLADDVIKDATDEDHGHRSKLQSAIRAYRRRDADINERRKAVATLADILERHRTEFKKVQFTRGDEGALFEIYNRFAIRHERKTERGDYSDEYLDWIFWVSLAAIQLVHKLGAVDTD